MLYHSVKTTHMLHVYPYYTCLALLAVLFTCSLHCKSAPSSVPIFVFVWALPFWRAACLLTVIELCWTVLVSNSPLLSWVMLYWLASILAPHACTHCSVSLKIPRRVKWGSDCLTNQISSSFIWNWVDVCPNTGIKLIVKGSSQVFTFVWSWLNCFFSMELWLHVEYLFKSHFKALTYLGESLFLSRLPSWSSFYHAHKLFLGLPSVSKPFPFLPGIVWGQGVKDPPRPIRLS